MYCPKCNTCYMDDGKFCQDCGAPLVQNSFYKDKKALPVKVILAVVALCLAIAAGYAFFKEEPKAPDKPGKSPDSNITRSALRFTATNPSNSGPADRHRARARAHDVDARRGAAGQAPAAACSTAAPAGVGAPRAAGSAAQGIGAGQPRPSSTTHRDAPVRQQPTGQTQMVVIRDPLSAEKRY